MTEENVPAVREIAAGLRFPEGPVAMPDGSVLVVEIERRTLSRVTTRGEVEVVADLGGGPNGCAIGPDGAAYVCNNGGFVWSQVGDWLIPLDLTTGANEPSDFGGGWIERVDLATGRRSVLCTDCDGHELRSPNDIVFDDAGGFWFTDLGKRRSRDIDLGGLYYAKADGSAIVEAAYPLLGPNGVGLAPDGRRVYVAESYTARLISWEVEAPGELVKATPGNGGTVVAATRGHFDSLAVEDGGNVVVAALPDGLCTITPKGETTFTPLPDPLVTNVCFTGDDMRTALVTLSGSGRLVAIDWPRPGLRLRY